MPVIIEFSKCIGTHSSAKFEYITINLSLNFKIIFHIPYAYTKYIIVLYRSCYHLSKCLLITNAEETILNYEGITINVVPIWKWLLHD